MPEQDYFSEIDGFASVLAVRRAKKRYGPAPASPGSSPARPGTQPAVASRISHSIMPIRFEVVCYECDYTFSMSGQLKETVCPKCRAQLASEDVLIDKEWFQPVRTIGVVEILSGGVLRGADIVAKDIVLAGNAEHGSIRACRRLELWPGARFDSAKLQVKDLVVKRGACFLLPLAIRCRNLEVEGDFNAIVFAQGVVAVRAGATMLGEIDCAHLIVEEGASLEAHVCAGARSTNSERI